jgi:hypothetical protein
MRHTGTSPVEIVEWQTSSSSEASITSADRELERRAVRKLDYTILPVMTMFYLLSFLVSAPLIVLQVPHLIFCWKDRANIGSLFPRAILV